MTLQENEQEIYNKLESNRIKLYMSLTEKINSDTNAHFYNVQPSIYSPTLDSSLEVIKGGSNSNAFVDRGDGVISLKGAVLKDGWSNTGLWRMSVDIRYDELRYVGLILLTDANDPFKSLSPNGGVWGIRGWEGPVTGTPYKLDGTVGNYTKTPNTTLSDSFGRSIPWYTLHMEKTSLTTLEVWKNDDIENKVTYEWEELSDAEQVTFGSSTNNASTASQSQSGSLFIRNLSVKIYPLPSSNYTVTKLCEDTKLIKSDTNNSAVLPSKPTVINSNALGVREYNIHNKIQYCNNLLRYTLRKNGIDFNNSNKMHELIKFIDSIEYDFSYVQKALQNISINNDGNLVIDEYEGNVYGETLVTDISFDANSNLIITKELIDNSNANNIIYNLRFDNDNNLIYDRVSE